MRQLVVRSGEVDLAVREHPRDRGPTVLLVHGFPDTQAMWDPVATRLTDEHGIRVITYDVRGAGESSAPTSRDGYRTERLVDDLVAVLDRMAPREAVHLVGHDWGSVQLWDAVTREADEPRLRRRIASFTSISGPCLDHVAHFVRLAWSERAYATLLRQGVHSWYVYAFHLPVLPELLWRVGAPLVRRQPGAHFGATLERDAANGVNLYRANIRRRMAHPGPGRTNVPVQLVVPERDTYITPAIFTEIEQFVSSLQRVDVDAGHWAPREQPQRVAGLIADHIYAHDHG